MPYIKTLKVLQTGNTSTGIFETMAILLNLTKDTHRVSFVHDRNDRYDSRLSVGDSLEVASPTSGKPRKKRWWEQKKETGQLRLPFSLYEPAKIMQASYDNSRRHMELKLRFVGVEGVEKNIILCHDGHDDSAVKAIRVHEVVKKWVESEEVPGVPPFSGTPSVTQTLISGQQSNLSQRDCGELVERAMEHGIAVTADHKVYDDITGELVGTEFQAAEARRVNRYISFRRLDGMDVHHRINHSSIRFVDSRAPSGTECRNMLETAMREGMVVTPAGKVYDAGSGVFLGTALRLTTDPSQVLFDDSYRGYSNDTSVRGDLIMPDSEVWAFQVHTSKVTHTNREIYTTPAWSERERRHRQYAMFAHNYGNMSNDWVNSPWPAYRYTGE
jgi:hypothetical protein